VGITSVIHHPSRDGGLTIVNLSLASLTLATADELGDRQGNHASQCRHDADYYQQLN
jgi:hypothetical protein